MSSSHSQSSAPYPFYPHSPFTSLPPLIIPSTLLSLLSVHAPRLASCIVSRLPLERATQLHDDAMHIKNIIVAEWQQVTPSPSVALHVASLITSLHHLHNDGVSYDDLLSSSTKNFAAASAVTPLLQRIIFWLAYMHIYTSCTNDFPLSSLRSSPPPRPPRAAQAESLFSSLSPHDAAAELDAYNALIARMETMAIMSPSNYSDPPASVVERLVSHLSSQTCHSNSILTSPSPPPAERRGLPPLQLPSLPLAAATTALQRTPSFTSTSGSASPLSSSDAPLSLFELQSDNMEHFVAGPPTSRPSSRAESRADARNDASTPAIASGDEFSAAFEHIMSLKSSAEPEENATLTLLHRRARSSHSKKDERKENNHSSSTCSPAASRPSSTSSNSASTAPASSPNSRPASNHIVSRASCSPVPAIQRPPSSPLVSAVPALQRPPSSPIMAAVPPLQRPPTPQHDGASTSRIRHRLAHAQQLAKEHEVAHEQSSS